MCLICSCTVEDDGICIWLCPCVYTMCTPTHSRLMDTGVLARLSLGDLSLYVRTSCHAEAETTLPRVDRSPLHRSTLLPCLKHKGNAPAWKCGSDTKPAGNQMSLRRVVELMLPLPFIYIQQKRSTTQMDIDGKIMPASLCFVQKKNPSDNTKSKNIKKFSMWTLHEIV